MGNYTNNIYISVGKIESALDPMLDKLNRAVQDGVDKAINRNTRRTLSQQGAPYHGR